MKKGKNINHYMTLDYEFTGLRVQEGFLSPVDWQLSVNLTVFEKKGKSKEELEHKANISYQRLLFWLDANLPSVMMVNSKNQDDMYLSNLSSNIAMYCPGEVDDDLITRLIHHKLTVLANNDLGIGELTLKADDTFLKYTYFPLDNDYSLPTSTEEYTEFPCRDELPWWMRNDGFCFEFFKVAENEEKNKELFDSIVDPMDDFEKLITEMSSNHIGITREPARIIQVEKWKPRKV